MSNLQTLLDDTLVRLRQAKTDLQDVEVKDASGGTPGRLAELVSAFATGSGGLLILGLSEARGFLPTGIDAPAIADAIESVCTNDVEPPVRADIDICVVDSKSVLVVVIDELPTNRKPCHVKSKGFERGVFVRTHDGLRAMTSYEVHLLIASRGQPKDDRSPVPDTNVDDLDRRLVEALLRRLRTTRGPNFQASSEEQILEMIGVITHTNGNTHLTLAGLMALGRYPQQFFPQLDITFVVHPTISGEPMADGTRFLDNQSIDGSIPAMVSIALAAMRRNMKRRSIVAGGGREDQWEYPEGVIRELVVNALMHRDYHPMAHGTQIRMMLFPDRSEIVSPGGLHGPISPESLLVESQSISRNATLAKLLEDVQGIDDNHAICENRGSGLLATATLLRRAGMDPPELTTAVHQFTATVGNHTLLDNTSLTWLASFDTTRLSDRQKLGLGYLKRKGSLTNRQYRTLNGCDALDATRDLSALHSQGWIEKRGDRRGTIWYLAEKVGGSVKKVQSDMFEQGVTKTSTHHRHEQILSLLVEAPRSTADIAKILGISRQGVLIWLRRLESSGAISRTEPVKSSPRNLWQLKQ